MKIFLILFLLIISISCKKKNDKITSMNQITTNYDTLRYRIIHKGNIDAYDELFYGFMDSNKAQRTDSLMIYSKIMAEKYNYEKAYFDFFNALCEKNDIDIDFSNYSRINLISMDKSSKKQAEEWLEKMLQKKMITQKQYDLVKK